MEHRKSHFSFPDDSVESAENPTKKQFLSPTQKESNLNPFWWRFALCEFLFLSIRDRFHLLSNTYTPNSNEFFNYLLYT